MAVDKQTVDQVLSRFSLTADKIVSIFTGLLAAFMILYSGYVVYENLYTEARAFGSSWDVLKYRPEIIDDDSVPLSASNMSEINEDYRAWLTIYDANIDYPVMQGKDDLYYSSHDVFKKTSLTGALYLAASNTPDFSDNYNIIYGHHMDVKALFGGLDAYREKAYFDAHQKAIVVTNNAVYDATVFAVMQTSAYNDMIYSSGGDRSLSSLLPYIKENSLIYDSQAADGAMKIVALSTCESAATAGRLIVFAKMVNRNVEPPVIPEDQASPASVVPGNPAGYSGDDAGAIAGNPGNPGGGFGNDDGTATGNPGNSDAPSGFTSPDENPSPTEFIENNLTPLVSAFHPSGSSYGRDAWALVNLICLIMTFFLVLPIGYLRAKYRRARLMDELNEDKRSLWYDSDDLDADEKLERARIVVAAMNKCGIKRAIDVTEEDFEIGVEELYYEDGHAFVADFKIGTIVEIVLAICALILFILTENMLLPMVLIDAWTPFMLLFLAVTWIIDVRLARYRNSAPEIDGEQDNESQQMWDAAVTYQS